MICKKCGKELVEGHYYCWNCGDKVNWAELTAQEKGKADPKQGYFWPAVAAFLFVLLGIPSCLGGGCLLLFAASGGSHYLNPYGFGSIWIALLEGLACIGLFVVLLKWLYRTHRSR